MLELFDAFQRSKQIAYERARRSAATYLISREETSGAGCAIGDDLYFGSGNGQEYRTRDLRSLEQGLLRKSLALEDIYYRTTLNT